MHCKLHKIVMGFLFTFVVAVLAAGCTKKNNTPDPAGSITLGSDVVAETTPETAPQQADSTQTATTKAQLKLAQTTAAVTKSAGYSNAQLCEMALDYYERHQGYRPSKCSVDQSDQSGLVKLHLYDDMGDHLATSAWYTVDRVTGIGIDEIFMNQVDLKN
jgi:hypothetical protein